MTSRIRSNGGRCNRSIAGALHGASKGTVQGHIRGGDKFLFSLLLQITFVFLLYYLKQDVQTLILKFPYKLKKFIKIYFCQGRPKGGGQTFYFLCYQRQDFQTKISIFNQLNKKINQRQDIKTQISIFTYFSIFFFFNLYISVNIHMQRQTALQTCQSSCFFD